MMMKPSQSNNLSENIGVNWLGRKKQNPYVITSAKILTPIEIDNLLRLCKKYENDDCKFNARNALALTILLECGMRAGELLGLTVADFNEENHTLFIRSLKGSNPRTLPIKSKRSVQILKAIELAHGTRHVEKINQSEKIFPITYDRLHQIWKDWRPNRNKGLHSLRHTFAVNLYLKTRDIKAVQIALGHRQIENTLVYVNFIYQQDELRRLMHG